MFTADVDADLRADPAFLSGFLSSYAAANATFPFDLRLRANGPKHLFDAIAQVVEALGQNHDVRVVDTGLDVARLCVGVPTTPPVTRVN